MVSPLFAMIHNVSDSSSTSVSIMISSVLYQVSANNGPLSSPLGPRDGQCTPSDTLSNCPSPNKAKERDPSIKVESIKHPNTTVILFVDASAVEVAHVASPSIMCLANTSDPQHLCTSYSVRSTAGRYPRKQNTSSLPSIIMTTELTIPSMIRPVQIITGTPLCRSRQQEAQALSPERSAS